MAKARWEDKARDAVLNEVKEAFEHYLEDLKRTLPPDASFADIERAMLKYSPQMMSSTAEALANAEDFSPEDASGTCRLLEERPG